MRLLYLDQPYFHLIKYNSFLLMNKNNINSISFWENYDLVKPGGSLIVPPTSSVNYAITKKL